MTNRGRLVMFGAAAAWRRWPGGDLDEKKLLERAKARIHRPLGMAGYG